MADKKRLPPKLPNGQRMTPNKVYKSTRAGKKKMVYATKEGKGKLIHFGDATMKDFTQHKSEKRRKSFKARFGGIKKKDGSKAIKDRHSAAYWSNRVLWTLLLITNCGVIENIIK